MKKELLTIGQNGDTRKYFIMGDHGQVPGTPYFDRMKDATIAMFRMSSKQQYTNIYNMPQKTYEREILGL